MSYENIIEEKPSSSISYIHPDRYWTPYAGDFVTNLDCQLWHFCTKEILWQDIEKIKTLLNDGANPFIRDIKGNFLTTVVFFGFWWTSSCGYQPQLHWHNKPNAKNQKVWISDGCVHKSQRKKIILPSQDNDYKTYIIRLLTNSMHEFSTKFYKKTILHDSHWSMLVPEFNVYAMKVLLINKSLNIDGNMCTYGILPRDIITIILGYVIENIISDIINNTKPSLSSFTIDNIHMIANTVKIDNQICLKRQRKQNLVDKVDLICSESKKHKNNFIQKCSLLPSVVGTIIVTDGMKTLLCDIPNPNIKPFLMVGRSYTQHENRNRYFDQVDFDLISLESSQRVSRNNIKVRFNPFSFQIEILLIGRNTLTIDGEPIDKSKWRTIMPGDVIIQETTNIQYSFINTLSN